MGTENGGNMFPGVTSGPYSVVKLGPDCGPDAYSGYSPTGNITAFSMMHESGTGGAPKYGVVSQQPVLGPVVNPLEDLSVPRSTPDQAQVGFYESSLSSGITVQLAATPHAGMFSYLFPESSQPNVVVDISHVLASVGRPNLSQQYVDGNLTVLPDGSYQGSGTYNNGWNLAPDWTIYFCGYFDTPVTSFQTFYGNGTTLSYYGSDTSASGTERVGAVFSFSQANVSSRVGISFISSAKACQFVDSEMPSGTPLHSLVTAAKSNWNTEVLSKIQTTETDLNTLQLLYSSLYGMHILPSNRTGENPLWTSTEPYYDDIFTFWDLFRCSTPLTQILQPISYEEQIRSIIDIWAHEGYIPDARSSNYNGRSQGGSNADNVLADAYVKSVRGAVNWTAGYTAMLKDAEVQPPNNNDPQAPESSTKEGRGALPDWLQYNYITPTYTRAVSRAIEYSANDFSLYQIATAQSNTPDASKYLARSRNWRNHWNPSVTSLNFSGFPVPRAADGTFLPQDPLSCGGCYWGDAYYEATPWEYAFNAHHDIATLISYAGGPETFVQRLDMLFTPDLNPNGDPAFGKTIFNPGNEPSFASPYLFNFAGRQDLSVQRSRYIAKSYYNTSPSGLPGNSDAGAMQTWLLWNMIGLYPLTGQTTFLIASPWFSMTIDIGGGKSLDVTVTGGNSDTEYYVQSLKVNGQSWNKCWLSWDDVFANGGTMEYVLGASPSGWCGDGEAPPSPAS
ncbi:hypothetical protein OEA41_004005 [Lepraria neglecta]|uniref:Glycoside hydrolase family 92 protein n=1 Tax=Lepraria neglecta TaxID=209136 RepID=A0AAD9Z6L7_9LECA|nr:hypothetical protein OEA41_004005 [Lepraria neglecta]